MVLQTDLQKAKEWGKRQNKYPTALKNHIPHIYRHKNNPRCWYITSFAQIFALETGVFKLCLCRYSIHVVQKKKNTNVFFGTFFLFFLGPSAFPSLGKTTTRKQQQQQQPHLCLFVWQMLVRIRYQPLSFWWFKSYWDFCFTIVFHLDPE